MLVQSLLRRKGDKPYLVSHDLAVEGGGIYNGYEYLIIFRPLGHRCGYIVIPEKSRIENDNYEDLDVHGGITFCDYVTTSWFDDLLEPWECHFNTYCIGFDTANYDDGNDIELSEKIWPLNKSRYAMSKMTFEEINASPLVTIKTYEFVETQCKHLIDQLVKRCNG
jgi:hypothetical protein